MSRDNKFIYFLLFAFAGFLACNNYNWVVTTPNEVVFKDGMGVHHLPFAVCQAANGGKISYQ